jgi:NitT/TauT family transport system ATP-binding protein
MSDPNTNGAPAGNAATKIAVTKIAVDGLTKTFRSRSAEGVQVLDDLSLDIRAGEFVSVIGPSGCGKSTLFNILAGLERPDTGTVTVDGVSGVGRPEHFAYMPQNDLMLPWRRIIDNAGLALEVQGMKRNEARARAGELFAQFGLSGFEHAWPSQLSGGMRQRVALLRTVVQNRSVLLLDEPFGALDSLTRTEMQMWLTEVWERYRWTVVLITHDIREAVFLSDRVYSLTGRPARVGAELVIDLPRPRRPEILASTEAAVYEGQLLETLERWSTRRPAGVGGPP